LLTSIIEVVAILFGTFFMFVAAVGVLRLKDFYMRVHAPTKAATLGLIFFFVAIAIDVHETAVVTKAILAFLFISATAPVGAHLLARAAYRNGVRPADETGIDQYARAVPNRGNDPTIDEPDHTLDLPRGAR
jgi:multicomponent Na+:H+ antiporter subunit G